MLHNCWKSVRQKLRFLLRFPETNIHLDLDSLEAKLKEFPEAMSVVRTYFENNNEVGVFSKLTNSYCMVAIGGSENFYSAFQTELQDVVPVVHASVAGCRIIGRMTVGNRHGVLVPNSTTDQELQVQYYSSFNYLLLN
mgnify:CR=1 FL=1